MNDRLLTKKDFPIYDTYPDLAYLDNSATQQKPRRILDAVRRYYTEENANPLRGLYGLAIKATDVYENARKAVRGLINASSEREIIFTRNATESINLVAYSWGRENIHDGDEILVAISEHHSNMLPWQRLAKEKNARVKYLECSKNGEYTAENLRSALTERTRIFAVSHMSNVFGRENPIKEFADICHANGVLIMCDGAQSIPHIPVDVKGSGVDFFVFSGHKMLAPMGLGVLYGKEELLDNMPPFLYGGEMIEYVTIDGASYAELPHKFEAGTVNAGGAAGLYEAIDIINSAGYEAIGKREQQLTVLAFEGMKEIPHVNIIGADDPSKHHGILTFTVDGVHPHDIAQIFADENICIRAGHHCAQPLHTFLGIPSTARMSLSFYNDENDIERFISVLGGIRRKMGYDR